MSDGSTRAADGASDLPGALAAAEERLKRLQQIGNRLATALSTDDVVDAVMEALQPPRGTSARMLWLVADDPQVLHLARSAGTKPGAAELFATIPTGSPLPAAVALRERRTVISPSRHDTVERFPDLDDAPRSSDGFIAVPLCVDDGALGVLAFGYTGPLNDADVIVLEAAASHVAQTLSRVKLSESLARRADDAVAAAQRERRRSSQFEFIVAVTEAAVTATDHRDLLRGVAAAAVPTLGDWCSLHFAPQAGMTIETVAAHTDPDRQPWADALAARFPLDPSGRRGVAAVIATGQTEHLIWRTDGSERTGPAGHVLAPLEAEALAEGAGVASVIIVPIETKRRVIGALRAVRTGEGCDHDQDDIALAETVAGRIADALDNIWLTEQHRHISVTLQQALLPPALPTVENLDVAATYLPAGHASDVGGDFYDLFALDATTTALLIGDACGTGPNAAALTGIARHTARAAARHGHDHRETLEWVNQAVLLSDRDLHCTACYATIEQPATPDGPITVRVTAGGHPLPIHKAADGTRTIGAPGTLLGLFDTITGSVDTAWLRPGEVIVFYTDGITDLPAPYGCTAEELAEHVASLPEHLTAREVGDAIFADLAARVPDSDRHDDVALVVIRDARPLP